MMFNLSLNGISQNSELRQCRPKSFGEVHDNYNWIECASAKNPDQNYYFNVRSHCRTWTRPVPENVDLPFFNPHLVPPQTSENENESSPPVSELDDTPYQDNEEYEEIENQNENEKQIFEIASKLFYHGSQNSRRSRRRIVEDISEKDSAFFETLPITDFLEVQYLSEDSAKRLRSPSSSSSESSEESNTKSSKESTSSSCHCSCCDVPKENSDGDFRSYESSTSYQSLSSNFSAPRLKEITFSDLMTEPRRKLKRRKKCKIEPLTKLTPEKRICDMYGIRTISYDPIFEYINPTLPNNAQPACLTDSSIENSPSRPKDVSDIDWKKLFDLPIHIEDPILSEVSSGSETTEPFEDSEYVKEVSPSKIIWRPWDEKKKSYEDILGGKVLCIKLHRIDLDKNYFGAKNEKKDYQMEKGKEKSKITGKPKENVNKENLNEDNLETEAEEVSEVDERKEDRRHKRKVGRFKKERSEENWEIEEDSLKEANSEIEDSEVEERFPRCLRPKKNTTIYVEPDTDEEYFEDYRHLKFSETIRRTTGRSFKERSDTEKESEIEKRDENKNKTTKDTSNDEHSKVHSESENNSKVEERIVKSNNTKENNSIYGISETEDSEREDSSDENSTGENNQICSTSLEKEGNDNYGWVIVNSEINKVKLKKVLVNSVSPENEKIDNSKLNVEEEKTIEVPKVQEESANKIQENEITDDKIEDLRVDFDRSKVKEKSFEIKDLERPTEIIYEDLMLIEKSKTLNSFTLVTKELTYSAELKYKEEEIKSQENEIQNGENSMKLDVEEEKSFGVKDDRPLDINFEDLTTKELTLKEKVSCLENLTSSISSTQADSAELKDKEEEIKSQANEIQIGEKSMELDKKKEKSVGIKNDRPSEINLVDLTEKTKNICFESLNTTTGVLTLQRVNFFESLISSPSSPQADFPESKEKEGEIKSQEIETQIGEKSTETDEEKKKSVQIKDQRLIEKSLNGCKLTTNELTLKEKASCLENLTSSILSTQTDSAKLKDKEEEIKSQENEIQNGENSIELDEEKEKSFGIKDDRLPEINIENLTEKTRTIYFESLNTTTRELFLQEVNFLESLISSVSPPQANFAELRDKEGEIKSQENETQIGEKPKEPDEEKKKSVEIKDDRPNENTEKTTPNSFESLNNCKATTRELTLQKTNSFESLTSTLSIQTTSEESTDTGEEIKSQENEIPTRKKQMELDEKDELLLIEGDQIEEEEKSIDLDEKELLLMEKDQGEDELQSIDLDEEELLLMENDQIESEKPLDLSEDEDEVFIIEKENNKSPEEKLIDPAIGKAESKTPEAEKPKNFSGIGKKKDERNKKLPLFEKGNEPEIILIESDNEEEELPLIKNGNKKRRTKKEKNKNVKKKDVDEEELSDTKTCSTLVESNSRSEDEDDDNKTDVDKDQILSETDTVIGDGGFYQSSIDSDVTEVCSELEYD